MCVCERVAAFAVLRAGPSSASASCICGGLGTKLPPRQELFPRQAQRRARQRSEMSGADRGARQSTELQASRQSEFGVSKSTSVSSGSAPPGGGMLIHSNEEELLCSLAVLALALASSEAPMKEVYVFFPSGGRECRHLPCRLSVLASAVGTGGCGAGADLYASVRASVFSCVLGGKEEPGSLSAHFLTLCLGQVQNRTCEEIKKTSFIHS